MSYNYICVETICNFLKASKISRRKGGLFRFVGFGEASLEPATPVGFNLTYQCPEGMVFDHDWLSKPFVLMTCQVKSGFFIGPLYIKMILFTLNVIAAKL